MAVGDQTITGEGAFDLIDGDRGELALTVPSPTPTTMELRVVDDVVYVMVPGREAQHPGKRWVQVDPEAAAAQPADTLGVQDPTELIGLVESATDFEETGTVTVFDFGTPVDVEAPPADEVVEAPAPALLPTV